MLTATQIAAFVGVALAGVAYVPQIWHLVRVHCSAGISRFAFCGWLGASLLVTTHAIATRAVVFILLGAVQIVATTVILIYTTKYASSYCVSHAPAAFGAETKPRGIGHQALERRPREQGSLWVEVQQRQAGAGRMYSELGKRAHRGPQTGATVR